MAQYMLLVQSDEIAEMPPEEEIQVIYKRSTSSTRSSWIELPGCLAAAFTPRTRPQLSTPPAASPHHRRTLRRGEGTGRWLLGHQGRRPRFRARMGHRGQRRVRRQDRGPTVPGRARVLTHHRDTCPTTMSRGRGPTAGPRRCRAGAPLGLRQGGSDSRPCPRRHRSRGGGRPGSILEGARALASDGLRPSPTGWSITTARNAAIDRIRRESSRDHRQAEPCGYNNWTSLGRPVRWATTNYV